jgi:integrase
MALNNGMDGTAIRALYREYDKSKAMTEFYAKLRGLRGTMNQGAQTRRVIMLKFFRDIGLDPDIWLDEVRSGKRSYEGDFNDYIKKLSDRGRENFSDNSLKGVRAALIKFAKCLKLPEPDLEKIGSAEKKNHTEPFTKEDMVRLINCCRNPRDRALIMLTSCSGLRISEVGHLKVQDVGEIFERCEEPYAVEVHEEIAKAKRGYVSFINQDTADSLKTWIESKGLKGEDWLFITRLGGPLSKRDIDMIFYNAVRGTNLQGKRVFHSLRKYCRTNLAKHVSDVFAEKIIGHGGGSLEQIYTTPIREDLRREYEKALPEFAIYKNGTNGRVHTLESEVDKLKEENERLNRQLSEYSGDVKARLEALEKQRDELMGLLRKKAGVKR